METPGSFRGQRIVGGSVALDLLNTQNGAAGAPPEDDVLTDYRDLLAWASHVGLLDAAEERRLRRRAVAVTRLLLFSIRSFTAASGGKYRV